MIAHLFDSPDGLAPLAVATLMLAIALGVTARRHDARRRLWLGESAGPNMLVPDAMLLGAVAAIGLALCGPLLTQREVRLDADGIDLVLLVDASRSMDARDNPPSRLRRAREAAAALLDSLSPDDRVGLVVFAGTGRTLAPLTPDHDVLHAMLDRIDSRTALPHGSDLPAGFSAAFELFDLDAPRRRAIVMLGDGEWPGEHAGALSRLAERSGVHVHAVLFGRQAGATIPDHGVSLIGSDGQPALTRRREEQARVLAERTDGSVLLADRWGRVDGAELMERVRGDIIGGGRVPVFEQRRAPLPLPFVLVAFVLLLAEGPLRDRIAARSRHQRRHRTRNRRSPPNQGRHPSQGWRPGATSPASAGRAGRRIDNRSAWRIAVVVSALVAGLGVASPGDLEPIDVDALTDALLRAGTGAVERGDDDEALRAFRAAAATAVDAEAAGTAHYQIGVWHLKHDDPGTARDAFLESLRLDPRRLDAVFNLEWSTLAIDALAKANQPAEPPHTPETTQPEEQRRDTANEPEPDPRDDSPQPEFERGPAAEDRPSSDVRPQADGIQTQGPDPNAGANGRALPDADELSWWLDLIEDEPSRTQRPDRTSDHGEGTPGPPW